MAKKYTEDLLDFVDGLNVLTSEFPEIGRHMINLIAHEALKIAKENVIAGGVDPATNSKHSKYTEELTEKLRKGVTGTPLVESGNLLDSLTVSTNAVAYGRIYVEISSDMVYARILEFGGHPMGAVQPTDSNPSAGAIPPRPYLRPAIMEAIGKAYASGLEARYSKACEMCVMSKKRKKGKNWWKSAFNGFSF